MTSTRAVSWRFGLGIFIALTPMMAAAQESGGSIGDAVVAFLTSRVNQRVGGGSAWHMATEALRVGGGEFIPAELGPDSPWEGDKVWGTLVTKISNYESWSDSAPENPVKPGDVIQLHSAEFGTVALQERFTGIVAEVNESGRPRSVFYQNLNRVRNVQKVDFDATALTSGWMRIYRPKARIDRPNEWKFTVVNNRTAEQEYDVMVGVDIATCNAISTSNTYGSFQVHWMLSDGTVPNLLLHSGGSYFMETGKGYEIPTSSSEASFVQLDE